jgi:HSP20 family molecular chaperone IbpA
MGSKDDLRDKQDPRNSLGDERNARVRRRNYTRPAVDIYSTDSEMVVLADMPGVQKDDLELTLEKEELVIEGRAAGREEAESALPWGYHRRFRLRTNFDRDRIRAGIRGGVLRVVLPKAAGERPQSVPVD